MLLLERKSVTLQHMFIDCLEVEDNLRMSNFFSDQDSGNKMENKLDLVEQHKHKETFSVHLKPSLSKQGNYQPNDVKENDSTNLFSGDCNQPVTNSGSGDFKKDFDMPIYDEYEDECLEIILKEPTVEPRSYNEGN